MKSSHKYANDSFQLLLDFHKPAFYRLFDTFVTSIWVWKFGFLVAFLHLLETSCHITQHRQRRSTSSRSGNRQTIASSALHIDIFGLMNSRMHARHMTTNAATTSF